MTDTSTSTIGMSNDDLIKALFDNFIDDGGSPKVTEFKRHMDTLVKSHIKPLCSGRGSSAPGGSSWRDIQKARFSGRGAKWVKISIDNLTDTLTRLDDDGIDTADYRAWINEAGYAWIRYSGPRVDSNTNCAAFEVRTTGSTYDCPKSLHYIPEELLDDTIDKLGGTPFAMGLEATSVKKDEDQVSEDQVSEDQVSEEVVEEVEEEVLPEIPETNDPADWDGFLDDEGLSAEVEGEDIFSTC